MPAPEAIQSSAVGRTVDGRYRLEELLNVGPHGESYRARHVERHRVVALKLVHAALADDLLQRATFMSELGKLASLAHPNIAAIEDCGVQDGRPWVASEWLEGETLAQRLQQGPLSPAAALAIVRPLLAALAAVHGAGLVHRNLKPENLFLERRAAQGRERLRLLDFTPASRFVPGTSPAERVCEYSPPELAAGEALDARSDVYAVAAMLIGMVNGIAEPAPDAREGAASDGSAAPLAAVSIQARPLPGLDARLVGWIRRATATQRRLRFADAAAALSELIDVLPRDLLSPTLVAEGAFRPQAKAAPRAARTTILPPSAAQPTLPSLSRTVSPVFAPSPPRPGVESKVAWVPKAAAFVASRVRARLATPTAPVTEARIPMDSKRPPAVPQATELGSLRPLEAPPSPSLSSEGRYTSLLAAGVFVFLVVPLGWFLHRGSRATHLERERARTPDAPSVLERREPSAPAHDRLSSAPPRAAAEPPGTSAVSVAAERNSPSPSMTEQLQPKASAPAAVVLAPVQPATAPAPATPRGAYPIVAGPGRPPVRDPWQEPAPPELRRAHQQAMRGALSDEERVLMLREYNRDHPDDVRGYLVIGQLYLNRLWRTDCVEEFAHALERDPTARGAPEILPALLTMVAQAKAPILAERLIVKAYGTEALDPLERAFEEVRNPEAAERLHALRIRILDGSAR